MAKKESLYQKCLRRVRALRPGLSYNEAQVEAGKASRLLSSFGDSVEDSQVDEVIGSDGVIRGGGSGSTRGKRRY